MSTLIAAFRKNATEEVRVSVDRYHGHELVNIRVWFTGDDGEMKPGRQGLALRLELLPNLRAALDAVGSAHGEG